jgi:hypothetical protein
MAWKSLGLIGVALTIMWSGTAQAIYQENEVTVTDENKAVPEQTVTLTVKEKDPKQPDKPAKVIRVVKYKTSKNGKVAVKIDDKENRPEIVYDVELGTDDGRKRVLRDLTYATLFGGALDFAKATVVSETPRSSEPPRQPRTTRPRTAQTMQPAQPVSYVPSGWALVIGVNLGGGQSWNRYEDFSIFDGDGFGGGGFLAARYYAPSGFFIGPEIGVMGLKVNGRNPDGAFSNIRWMAFEGGQIGYSFNKPGTTPLNVYFGAGAAQAGYRVGIDTAFSQESMNLTLNGWSVHAGLQVQPAPQSVPNLWIGLDYRYSELHGTIDVDPVSGGLHFISATMSYQFPVRGP